MRLIGRRPSRRQRVKNQVKNLKNRVPSPPSLPGNIRADLPELPSVPDLDVRNRISRDSNRGSESPMLSLAGGLLLGLLVGLVVAVLLIARNEQEDEARNRQTGITLLSGHGETDRDSSGASAAVTG